jgi:hypothetical protein
MYVSEYGTHYRSLKIAKKQIPLEHVASVEIAYLKNKKSNV